MWLVLMGPLLLAGAGSGAVAGPDLTLAVQGVPRGEGSAAAAMLQTGQRVGSAVGLALLVALADLSGAGRPAADPKG